VDVEGPSSSTAYFENSLDSFSRSDNKHMVTSIHSFIYSDDANGDAGVFARPHFEINSVCCDEILPWLISFSLDGAEAIQVPALSHASKCNCHEPTNAVSKFG
jgi:hypothetical protein